MPSEVFKLFLWKSALPGKCSICIFLTYTSYRRLSVAKIIFANISGSVYADAGPLGADARIRDAGRADAAVAGANDKLYAYASGTSSVDVIASVLQDVS